MDIESSVAASDVVLEAHQAWDREQARGGSNDGGISRPALSGLSFPWHGCYNAEGIALDARGRGGSLLQRGRRPIAPAGKKVGLNTDLGASAHP